MSTYYYNNKCTNSCPDGTYPDNASSTCLICSIECTKCSSLTVCSECDIGYYLTANNTCETQCITTTNFPNYSSKSCEPCNSDCSTCINTTDCLTCVYTKDILNYQCLPNGQVCPLGMFKNNNICLKCHPTCESCTDYTVC